MDVTIATLARDMQRRLVPVYGEGEAKAMVRLIFHSLKGWSLTDMMIHSDNPASEYLIQKTDGILNRLMKFEPIQYILGEAYFYGMTFKVTPATLIPRPETEGLVDMIVNENQGEKDLSVLDIGTGSGAIAIALSRNLPFSEVSAIDISPEALEIAEENAQNLHAQIAFINADVFSFMPKPGTLDIIASNPPYIDESEKDDMEPNVVDYEPHQALFVPDSSPLLYYSRITDIAETGLRSNGRLYLEINPRHADELKTNLEKAGFADVTILNDINGKRRFIKCLKP